MAKSDVFLKEDRVSVVGGDGAEVADDRERGDLEVTVGKDTPPSVTLNADRANLTLGGGAGKAPEGDVKLLDESGTNRVQISAENDVNNRDKSNAGEQTVWIDGGAGAIQLAPSWTEWGTIEPSAVLDGSEGSLSLADPGANAPHITLDATTGDVTIDGSESSAGRIDLLDGESDDGTWFTADADDDRIRSELRLSERDIGGVDLYTMEPPNSSSGSPYPAGVAELYDQQGNKGVEIQGNGASITLGYSFVETREGLDGSQIPISGGNNGKIFLDDGDTGAFIDTSTVFEIRASQGKLEISTADGGQPLFTIDPGNDVVEIPSDWKLQSGNDTVLD